MKFHIAIAGALAFLCPFPHCAADDWTTTDGKTYHDVKDLGHNTLSIHIGSREGDAWLKWANLPPDLQKKYHYDATHEREMDAYLIQVSSGLPGVPPDPALIQKYALQVKQLIADPTVLKNLPSPELIWLLRNRLIVGSFLSYRLPPADAIALQDDEIKLTGLMLMALESRIDPAIDTQKGYAIDDTGPEAQKIRDQQRAKRYIWDFVNGATWNLKSMFHHQIDHVSIDAQVRPVLTQGGIDPASIDLLVGKTKASDH